MHSHIVLTLTGKDRVGIVEEITQLLVKLGGNVESSQMARLGGEFAILMLVALPAEQSAKLEQATPRLIQQGYKITISQTEPVPRESRAGWLAFQIEVEGADHEGIIHEIAQSLATRGISFESMETSTHLAPMSGSPLFRMTANIITPPDLAQQDWQAALTAAGRRLDVEITVTAAKI